MQINSGIYPLPQRGVYLFSRRSLTYLVWVCILCGFFACKQETTKPVKPIIYDGPQMEVDNIQTLFSDSAHVKVKMTAPKQLTYTNGDEFYPKGINIVFYEKDGSISATLRSDKAKKLKDKEIYTANGNVVIVNNKKGETINTEELNWSPRTRKIYTEKFVTITTADELLKGEGMDTDQDFTFTKIRKPSGIFPLKH
ncbi:MAG: LPS export ABC transporter periplasmic protein LptC [Bacteroidota bacterium]